MDAVMLLILSVGVMVFALTELFSGGVGVRMLRKPKIKMGDVFIDGYYDHLKKKDDNGSSSQEK